jgi:putative transposase
MTIARRQQISLDHTPYYHCTSRCVRRAFLCGKDCYTGQNFDHRRQWMEDRLVFLSKVFAVDLLAYAIMSNHYHVVVRIDRKQADAWSDADIIEHWGLIYAVPTGEVPASRITIWRDRLMDISWFMRCINEPVARRANQEDRCKGRFWEGRFKSQALLDEMALLRCMAYVDLNPIRAKMAASPEASEHTSIKSRIEGNPWHLLPFDTNMGDGTSIPITFREYLLLLDWTGRALQSNKRGAIAASQPPILKRLGWEAHDWVNEMRNYGRWYCRAVGSVGKIQRYCEHLGQQWLKGGGACQLQELALHN